jgi:hypothetical protein
MDAMLPSPILASGGVVEFFFSYGIWLFAVGMAIIGLLLVPWRTTRATARYFAKIGMPLAVIAAVLVWQSSGLGLGVDWVEAALLLGPILLSGVVFWIASSRAV